MRCFDAPFNAYSLYLAPQFFSKNYYLPPHLCEYLCKCADISINGIPLLEGEYSC